MKELSRLVALVGLTLIVLASAACQAQPAPTPLPPTPTAVAAIAQPPLGTPTLAPPTATEAPVASAESKAATLVVSVSPTSRSVENMRQPSIAAKEMQWETNGGGQITFSVARNGRDYDVHVTSYQFEDRDVRFVISADSGEVYGALSGVMQDQSRIRTDRSGPPKGSWTTIRLSDGEHSSVYEDAIGDGRLPMIYKYVVAQIEPI